MVVDDNLGMQCVTRSLLQKAGYEVATTGDGFAALAHIVEFRPQLILLDVKIPRINGYQVCAVIKQNPLFKETPVILLGAKDREYDRVRGRVVGASHYILKPFTRDELLEVISRYLDEGAQDIVSDKMAS